MTLYDRLMFGGLKLRELPPALTTEFNVIRYGNGSIFGILVRSPEPFNDPKIPADELADTITCISGGTPVISEDCANVFIPLSSAGTLTFTFNLKGYDSNSQSYSNIDDETVNISIP